MVITFSNIKGSAGGGGGATGGTVSGITLWSDETTKAYIDNALSGVTDELSAYTKTEDFAKINGSAITSGGNIVIEEMPYTAGTNIDITDHIISVTGISVPTKVSELVNDSGYITTADTQNFVTSGDVQTQINDSISGKADSSAVTAQISEVKQEIEAKIPSKVSDLQNDLNFVNSGDVKTQIDNAVNGKQDTLVSGENIKTINNQSLLGSGNIEIQGGGETYSAGEGIGIDADNIISVTGNYETIVELTQSEYDALTSYGKNTTYVITDAPAVNLSAYTPTSGFSTINGNVITDGGNIVIEGGNAYNAGANIDISTDNVISVTGITMPTKLSELTNDEGFVNSVEVETQITNKGYPTKNWVQDQVAIAIESETARTESTYAKIGDIPTKTSDLTNDSGFITDAALLGYATEQYVDNSISGKVDNSALTQYYTSAQTDTAIQNATNGLASEEWVESQGYLTEHQSLSAYTPTSGFSTINGSAITEGGNIVIEGGSSIKNYQPLQVEFSPNYSFIDAYEISSIGTQQFYKRIAFDTINGNSIIHESDNDKVNWTIPTSTSALTNDSGYVTSGEVNTQIESKGYLTGYTETDPVFMASAASGITSQDITNWNAKLDSSDLEPYYTSAQTDNAINNAVSGKADSSAVTAQISEVKQEIEAKIPTKVSSLENDLNFVNSGDVKTQVESYNYINSGQAQIQIDNSISGKLDTDIFTAYTANTQTELNNKQDASGMTEYATTAFTESTYLKEHQSLSAYSTTEQVQTLINTAKQEVENEIPDVSNFVTSAQVETQITNKGYITGYTETDPVFMASAASGITSQDITNWNGKQPSGDYALRSELPTVPTSNTAFTNDAGYITDAALNGYATTAFTESTYLKEHQSLSAYTPTSGFSTINGNVITDGGNIVVEETTYSGGTNINITDHIISVTGITIPTSNTAFTNDAGYVTSGEVETQITSKGYITAYTETDPVFQASAASGISTHDITNWNNKLDSSALNPYYTSAETDTAISNAVSGKTDKISVTASSGGYKFPKWNNQGCITGTSATAYRASQNINGSNRTVYSNSSEALPTIYAPESEGLAGQPLLSNGSGAPVWGAYKFQFISQSQYDALATKDSTTIYFIVNEN